MVGQASLALADGVSHDLDEADEVLADTPLDPGPELAAWLTQQRERRRGRVRHSLAELADMAEHARDYDDALSHARELLALEPLSEDAHRRLIRLHYLAGDRSAALLAFDRCEQVLKDEVGTRPSADTLALLGAVEQSRHLPGQALAPPPAVLRPPRLVGRARELQAARGAWRLGQIVTVVGEAGPKRSAWRCSARSTSCCSRRPRRAWARCCSTTCTSPTTPAWTCCWPCCAPKPASHCAGAWRNARPRAARRSRRCTRRWSRTRR